MTDAALAMKESAIEEFVESLLTTLGADIRKDGHWWTVTLPEDAETDLSLDEATLVVTNDPGEVDGGEIAVAPETTFVERRRRGSPTSAILTTGPGKYASDWWFLDGIRHNGSHRRRIYLNKAHTGA